MKITKTKLKQIIKEELEALEKTDDAADSPQGKGARIDLNNPPNNPPIRYARVPEGQLNSSLRLIMVALSKTNIDPFARYPRGTPPPMSSEARDMADEIISGKMSLSGAIVKLIRASSVANPPAID